MPKELKDIVNDGELISWVLSVKGQFGLTPLAEVPMPSITVGNSATTIDNITGATVYFTVDGSTPVSTNSAATLYAAPFANPASGVLIRAAAYKSPAIPSSIAAATVP